MPALTRTQASKNRSGANHRGGGGHKDQKGPFAHVERQYNYAVKKVYKMTTYCQNLLPKLLYNPSYTWTLGLVIVLVEAIVSWFIINYRQYTEIDWVAYMEQAGGFLNGTWDYGKLTGGTGPLVYPAGHLYIYSLLYKVTENGTSIRTAQYIFAALYLVTLLILFRIYHHAQKVPPYVMLFLSFGSLRIHSIYMLRLFNDPIAMTLFYLALLLFLNNKWMLGCAVYSLSVSVKMNILLFSPALFCILVANFGFLRTGLHIFLCAIIQVVLGAPFLVTNPVAYIRASFDFGRVFLFKWTVNWKFVPENIFVDRRFHIALLVGHITVLALFATFYWFRTRGGLIAVLKTRKAPLIKNDIIYALFTANLIGVMFARSLHYQFYSWYYHTIPYLFWSTPYPTAMKLASMGVLEMLWYTYPPQAMSSVSLHAFHLILFLGLLLPTRSTAPKKEATD